MLVIKDFKKVYEDETEITYDIQCFPTQGLIHFSGENGIGKTTFFNVISGCDTEASLAIINNSVSESVDRFKNRVSYLKQEVHLIEEMTGYEALILMHQIEGVLYDKDLISDILVSLNLDHVIEKPVKSYSVGQKRKLEFIRLLISRKKILILDEPFAQVDKESVVEMMGYLNILSKDKLIIYSNHEAINVTPVNKDMFQVKEKAYVGFIFKHFLKKSYIYQLLTMIILILGMSIYLFYVTTNEINQKHVVREFYQTVDYGLFESHKADSNALLSTGLTLSFETSEYMSSNVSALVSNSVNELPLLYGVYPSDKNEILMSYHFAIFNSDRLGIEMNSMLGEWVIIDEVRYQIKGILDNPLKRNLFTNDYHYQVFLNTYPDFYLSEGDNFNAPLRLNLLTRHEIDKLSDKETMDNGYFYLSFNEETESDGSLSIAIFIVMIVIVTVVTFTLGLERTKRLKELFQGLYHQGVYKKKLISSVFCLEVVLIILSVGMSLLVSSYLIGLRNEEVRKTFFIDVNVYKIGFSQLIWLVVPALSLLQGIFIGIRYNLNGNEASS
jgi:ABC-2 type transport system ATP-binding protein